MDVVEKKEIVHEVDQYEHDPYCYGHRGGYGGYWNYREPASKGVAGAGLGLGIAGTALGLLALSGRGLFGLGNNGCGASSVAAGMALSNELHGGPTAFQAWQKACDGEFSDQKALYDYALLSQNARFNDRETINSQMFSLYKSQIDADFGLYKNQRDQFDVLADRIGKLETATAVNAAIEPWRSKVLQMQIGSVAGMVQLEAERRSCADNTIVNYANTTFYPVSVANPTLGTTTTPRNTFNPLNECCCTNGYGTSTTAPAAA